MRLRLVGDGPRTPAVTGPDLTITLEIRLKSGRIDVDTRRGVSHSGLMPPDPGMRLAPAGNSIGDGVDAWLSNLATRGKRPTTIKSYRQLLKSAAPELGWVNVADISAESVMAWAGAKRQGGAWSGTTMNRQVGALQSLSRFLTKKRWLPVDPLLGIDRAEDDGGDGARAATTDEARALIRWAWERQQIDRRAVGNRALVWHCMFSMGLRASEPAAFRWRCLFLDEPVPFVRWTREMHKAFRPCEVALTEEVVILLRQHRALIEHGPDDPVFPILPPRVTFRKDRDAASIPAYDRRGRGFSPHSARKFFAHALTVAGVEGRVIDTLMRHSTGTPGRYPDLLPADQAPYLALLPRLWPVELSTICAQVQQPQSDENNLKKTATLPIAIPREMPFNGAATPMQDTFTSPAQSARPGVNALVSQSTAPTWRADSSGNQIEPSGRLSPSELSESAEVRLPLLDSTSPIIGAMVDELARRLKGASDGNRPSPGL